MSDSDPFSALFHTLASGYDLAGRVMFINAVPGAGLGVLEPHSVLVQPYQPAAGILQAQGFQVLSDIPDDAEFDHVIMLVTKNHEETRALMARGLMRLKMGGIFTVAGANDAGGKRIEKDFVALGLSPVSDSKHKSRVVQARKENAILPALAAEWITQGDWQPILQGRFISRPGLFSWDRVDKGSTLLAEHIPAELSGGGADFGCGYGYLSVHVLSFCSSVTHITALDADHRAVEACRQNTNFASGRIDVVWHDLTQLPRLKDLDFIVMNPPFHEGARTQNQLGISFIRHASLCLRKGGRLYMVANNHLPYEEILRSHFRDVQEVAKDHGFKIIRAST